MQNVTHTILLYTNTTTTGDKVTSIFYNKDFYYNETAKAIADEIWEYMSKGSKECFEYNNWDYPIMIDHEEPIFQWDFSIQRSDNIPTDYDIWASAGWNGSAEPSISVSIILPKGKWVKRHKVDYAVLFGTIAHELHHLAQGKSLEQYEASKKHFDKKEAANSIMKYYLSQCEIESFHIGFRAQCAVSGESLEDAMRYYLSHQDLSEEQVQTVIDAWLNPTFEIAELSLI